MFTRPFDIYALVPEPRTEPDFIASARYSSQARGTRCKFCAESPEYFSDTELEVHKQREHTTEVSELFKKNRHVCRMCLKKNATKADLLKHFKTAHLFCDITESRIHRGAYICAACHRLFFSKLMLAYHLYLEHKFKTPGIQCPKCEKLIRNSSTYRHFQAHLLESIFTCPLCFIKFKKRSALQNHVQSYHPYNYKCNMCSYESKKHHSLMFHVEKVHERKTCQSLDPKVLKKCFIEDVVDSKIARYIPALATKGLSLKGVANLCILCREICESQQEMLDHYATAHLESNPWNGEKKYKCHCGDVFFSNVLLKQHVFKLKGLHGRVEAQEAPRVIEDSRDAEINVQRLRDQETRDDRSEATTCDGKETVGGKATTCGSEEMMSDETGGDGADGTVGKETDDGSKVALQQATICGSEDMRGDDTPSVTRNGTKYAMKTYHVAKPLKSRNKYECHCGEVFVNNEVFFNHVFKLKGPHRTRKKQEAPRAIRGADMKVERLMDQETSDATTYGGKETIGGKETTCGSEEIMSDETRGDVPTAYAEETDDGNEVAVPAGGNIHANLILRGVDMNGNIGAFVLSYANIGACTTTADAGVIEGSINLEHNVQGEDFEKGIVSYTIINPPGM